MSNVVLFLHTKIKAEKITIIKSKQNSSLVVYLENNIF